MQGVSSVSPPDSQKSNYTTPIIQQLYTCYPQFLLIPGSNQPLIMKYCSRYLVGKKIHIIGPMPFKPILFKGQLYLYATICL